MKRFLLPLLLFFVQSWAFAQIGAFWAGANSGGPVTTPYLPPLTEVGYTQMRGGVGGVPDPSGVARCNPDIYTGVIDVVNDYEIEWYLITEGRDTIATGTTNVITYDFPEDSIGRSYDIGIDVSWGVGGIKRIIRRGIWTVSRPVYHEGDPGVTTIDVSTWGFTTSPTITKKILLKGVRHDSAGSLRLINFNIPGEWITIQADSATLVQIKDQWTIGNGCNRIVIDGCTNPYRKYGFYVEKDAGEDVLGISPGQYGTNYADSLDITGVMCTGGSSGFHILPPDLGPDGPPTGALSRFRFFGCLAFKTGSEGMYLGYTRDYQGYAELDYLVVAYCRADSCGWDGIQPGNATNVEVQNCVVYHCGLDLNVAQYSGISCNGFQGLIYFTEIDSMYVGVTGSTGAHHGGVHIFRCYIHSPLEQSAYHNWYRLGDASINPPDTVDFCVYLCDLDMPDGNEIWGTYLNGPDEPKLNWQFPLTGDYANNIIHGDDPPAGPYSYWYNAGLNVHWLSIYDRNGYLTYTIE